MTTLPPTPTSDRRVERADSASPRRRLGVALATTGALGIGSLALGAQIAGASAPDADGSIEASSTGATSDPDAANDDITVVDDKNLDEQFEAYDTCMAEQLPDIFGDDAHADTEIIEVDAGELGDIDVGEWQLPDFVTVQTGGEDGRFTVLDLGEGDGTITITKTDGEVQVSTDGDVEEFDLDEIEVGGDASIDDVDPETEAQSAAEMERFDAAHDACADELPDVAEMATVVGEPGTSAPTQD